MRSCLCLLAAALAATAAGADEPARFAARLLFQAHDARALKWADVRETSSGARVLGPVAPVSGFPKLDPAKQTLVQMKLAGGRVLAGVRDEEEGTFGSGWVLLATGVRYQDHGDHGHWRHEDPPTVLAARIDADQGNPAHVYEYGGKLFLAQDRKNGYSRFDPAEWYRAGDGTVKAGTPRFVPGGGGHITLAVADDRVGYSAWIDGDGPNKGRVDVTPLAGPTPSIAYSFRLPTGGIHGAAACAGKVFFAPADGLCWVPADPRLARTADDVQVNHLPLGKGGEKPNRTGAFATHGCHVLCVTGRGEAGKLVVVNARAADPKPVFVCLNGKAGNKPVTPAAVDAGGKTPLALVFHDRPKDVDAPDLLDVVALDPDGNGDFADARVVRTLAVGRSAVDGHHGHHAVGFDADGRTAYFTNPGDGTVSALDLKKLEVVATWAVGGTPTAIVVHGGRDPAD